ncbi:MAG: hypothetical protein RL220_425 [Bacteroidota bacterium]|jgi:putative membrane protein
MHAGQKFGLKEALYWTRRDIYLFVVLSLIPTIIYESVDCKFIAIPWLPVAMIGTAVAFLIGFKNNATYDRMWEARRIWGGIVNSSRTWGIMSRDFVTNKHAQHPLSDSELKAIHRRLIMRHVAWLTTLRYQLRQERVWESMSKPNNREYKKFFSVAEYTIPIEEELKKYLSPDEMAHVLKSKNMAAQVISLQSSDIRQLHEQGLLDDFRHVELEELLALLYDHQGASERIKNFPYPRQFATLNFYFVWLFVLLLPFGMLNEFSKLGDGMTWLTVPFSTLVSWVFRTMEQIGEVTENPFQGGANDVPITAMSRTIEIDLLEMLGEKDLPEPLKPVNNILM